MSIFAAVLHGAFLSSIYVGSIYWFTLRLPRDDPREVRRRMAAVGLSTVVSLVYTALWHQLSIPSTVLGYNGFIQLLGMGIHWFHTPLAIAAALLLNSLLFMGPILHMMMTHGVIVFKKTKTTKSGAAKSQQRDINRDPMSDSEIYEFWEHLQLDWRPIVHRLQSVWRYDVRKFASGLPAFIRGDLERSMSPELLDTFKVLVFGPITEEIVYRSCMFYLMHFHSGSQLTPATVVWTSAIIFGIAHCHHIVDHILHAKMQLQEALMQVTVQLVYTSVFALYCGFVFSRTQQLAAPLAMHVMCNFMGLPDFQDIVQHHAQHKLLRIALLIGLVAFVVGLFPLTSQFLFGSVYARA